MGSDDSFVIEPTTMDARVIENQIVPSGESINNIRNRLLDEEIIILKDVFEESKLRKLRHRIHHWGISSDTRDPNEENISKSFHFREDDPQDVSVPRVFRLYNFKGLLNTEYHDIDEKVASYFQLLNGLQNQLGEYANNLEHSSNGAQLHPGVLHYPSGGGHFSMHCHPYRPQRFGQVLSLSEPIEDFERGGTRFASDGKIVDIEGHHSIGDIALFRYDLPHEVTPTDPTEPLRWESERGRWSMVISYY